MPSYFIENETGSKPDKWFTKPFGFSGAHDKTAKLVESGAFEAGVLSYKKYDSMVESGKLDKEKCKIFGKHLTMLITIGQLIQHWTKFMVMDSLISSRRL